MLIRYRKDYQKIAVGLLTFRPELRNYHQALAALQMAIEKHFHIFLWKDTEDNHFIAVAIVEVGPHYALLRQLSFTPTERSGHNVFAVLSSLHEQYSDVRLMGTLQTQPLISTWERSNERQ